MTIISQTQSSTALLKSMPKALTHSITVGEHFKQFYLLDTCDVWTSDGWLVTAVQNDGKTHHLRKGSDIKIETLHAEMPLFFVPNAKARHFFKLQAHA